MKTNQKGANNMTTKHLAGFISVLTLLKILGEQGLFGLPSERETLGRVGGFKTNAELLWIQACMETQRNLVEAICQQKEEPEIVERAQAWAYSGFVSATTLTRSFGSPKR